MSSPEPRRWKAWAVLEHDESLYGITMLDPQENGPLRQLIAMGWFAVPVELIERDTAG